MADANHIFTGEDVVADLHAKPLTPESRSIPSEQYNSFDYALPVDSGFDGFDKVWNKLLEPIGLCIVVYSELENALEHCLYELISDRSDHLGMLASRQLTYIQKANLYIDLLRSQVGLGEEYQNEIKMLKKHLLRAAEIRNIVAHAKWPSITEDGFVFSSVEAIDANHGIPDMLYYKLNKQFLDLSFDYISAVANMPYHIHEKYLDR